MVDTIDDMMALARSDDPHASRAVGVVDLSGVVSDAIELNRAAAEHAGVRLYAAVTEPPVLVTGDLDGLDKLVHNLISNAIKYTPAGAMVTVSCCLDGDQAVLVCRDEGIGITAEDQARLFDEFFRSSDPAVRERPGTGLGLAIVRRVVDRHHGEIIVDSRAGVGSTFTVRIPQQSPHNLHVSSPRSPAVLT